VFDKQASASRGIKKVKMGISEKRHYGKIMQIGNFRTEIANLKPRLVLVFSIFLLLVFGQTGIERFFSNLI
jgi:hypothetical protein